MKFSHKKEYQKSQKMNDKLWKKYVSATHMTMGSFLNIGSMFINQLWIATTSQKNGQQKWTGSQQIKKSLLNKCTRCSTSLLIKEMQVTN